MLKASLFALVLAAACTAAALAEPAPLIVGSVRDGDGVPVVGARVRALDARGATVGAGPTDAAGTFALAVAAAPAAVTVACAYCAPRRIELAPATVARPVIVIVVRYRALFGPALDQRDFAALPYPRQAQAIALAPFVVPLPPEPNGDVPDISDRGLERGYGLVLDGEAPAYDLVHGGSALADFPAGSIASVQILPATEAYRYGSYAGGGTFVLDDVGAADAAASANAGPSGSVAGYARAGDFAPVAALSQGDDTVNRRASLDYEGNVAGGALRVEATASDQRSFDDSLDPDRFSDVLYASYATASRRYRTFFDGSASETGVDDGTVAIPDNGRSSQLVGDFRLEHPGTITTAFGIVGEQYTGGYSTGYEGQLSARVTDDLAYLEARGGARWISFDAGASVSQIALGEQLGDAHESAQATTFLPSLSVKVPLGAEFDLTASASRSLRVPTLLELAVNTKPLAAQPLEYGSLTEAGFDFDDARRIRAGATLFHENLDGFSDRSTTGLGFSLAWQVAPLISLRAWTLHNASVPTTPPLPFTPYTALSLSRSVGWASYDNNGSFRVDLIARRDLFDAGAETDIDGDVVFRLSKWLDGTAGTSRFDGRRTSYIGIRLPLGGR